MRSMCMLFLVMIGLFGCGGSGGSAPSVGTPALVIPALKLMYLTIDPVNTSIAVKTSLNFKAIGTYSDNTTQDLTTSVNWTSSNLSVVTIDPKTGVAKAVSAGPATITAISTSGPKSDTTLKVLSATLKSIAVTPPGTTSIAVKTDRQFIATGTFSDDTTQAIIIQDITTSVSWTSSNPSAATININGLATSVAINQTTNIVASLELIVSTPIVLNVTDATLKSIAVTSAKQSVSAGTSQQFIATGTYSDNTTQPLTTLVKWTSSIPKIVEIDPIDPDKVTFGKVIAVLAGDTTIIATLGAISGSTPLTVTPAVVTGIWTGQYQIYSDSLERDIPFNFAFDFDNKKVTLRDNAISKDLIATVDGNKIGFSFTYPSPKNGIIMKDIGEVVLIDGIMKASSVKETYGDNVYNVTYNFFNVKKL